MRLHGIGWVKKGGELCLVNETGQRLLCIERLKNREFLRWQFLPGIEIGSEDLEFGLLFAIGIPDCSDPRTFADRLELCFRHGLDSVDNLTRELET